MGKALLPHIVVYLRVRVHLLCMQEDLISFDTAKL
jgi:hypothetical protein